MIIVRDAVFPQDEAAIRAIDTGFATDTIFTADVTIEGVTVERQTLEHPMAKMFPIDDLAPPEAGDLAIVAEEGQRIVGFAAATFHEWNRRLAVDHFYVQPSFRGKGVGRQLMDRVGVHARRQAAAEVWVETSNINAPGLAIYERLGFALSGIDTTLYAGTASPDEFAFFLSKPLSR